MIIPYHLLDSMLPPLLAELGILAEVPHLNVSIIARQNAWIPEPLIEEVYAHYAADYALLDQLADINAAGMDRLRQRHG